MSDLFASYADQAVSPAMQRRQAKAEAAKPKSALDLKMEEKQRLSKAYRLWKSAERAAVLAAEPRLRDFLRYLRSVRPDAAGELLEAIAGSWLVTSPRPIRLFALDLVRRHCDRINRRLGFEPLDDPIPPETTLYFRARDLLYPGGYA